MKKCITVDGLYVKYGRTPALAGVSLNIHEGDYLGIIGPNGGGKTTLLKAILGLVRPISGTIDIYDKKPGRTGKLIGYVPQTVALDRKFPITVKEVILTGRINQTFKPFYKFKKIDIEKVDELLNKVGIYKLKSRMISDLSGGEFQKMLIARALAVEPKILVLDEPTASVDASSRNQIFSLLSSLNSDMTIILVTHDLYAVSSYADSLACINGRLDYYGDTEINEEIIKNLYGFSFKMIENELKQNVSKKNCKKV